MNVYHVGAFAGNDPVGADAVMMGVCAASKTDAARIAHERLLADGYTRVRVVRYQDVGASTWEPGNTMIYSAKESPSYVWT